MLIVCSQKSMCETQYALKLLRGLCWCWWGGGSLIFPHVFMLVQTGIHY